MSPPDLPPVPPNRCASYQTSKKRYCKGRPLPPSLYCGNHKHLDFDEKEYVECPIGCGNVFMKQSLAKHKKVCNKMRMLQELQSQPYYSLGINLPSLLPSPPSSPLPPSSYVPLALQIRSISLSLPPLTSLPPPPSPPPSSPFLTSKIPLGTQKHITQIDSLTHTILPLLPTSPHIIEYGSGRGMLGLVLSGTMRRSVELTLIERGTSRRQADKFPERDRIDVKIKRLRVDVEDVDMCVVCGEGRTGVVAKHLCGRGTDVALRASLRIKDLEGLGMATCCHGVCEWEVLCGRESLGKAFKKVGGGFGKEVFEVMKKWTGALTADDSEKSVNRDRSNEEEGGNPHKEHIKMKEKEDGIPGAGQICQDERINFTKQQLGRWCQRLIDWGRMEWVKENLGLEGGWGTYVGEDVSPQNCLIWGKRKAGEEAKIEGNEERVEGNEERQGKRQKQNL
ncbi:hypothetical protein TrVE_jg6025 [Triparma verrucosa]|uniref:tRNA:m(4)X modification enzyme TRM13 n=1 Tax=Triparma verrucosa TaxID=1606542 RepID=A0A9W7KXI5_9STRA|nr:hypothetical protein TrVE_jg6025 [Triparma verrucosa]